MGAPHVIPFNYQPITNPAKKVAQYTVPAGIYALVKAISPYFLIDSVAMFSLETAPTVNTNDATQAFKYLKGADAIHIVGGNHVSSTNNGNSRSVGYGFLINSQQNDTTAHTRTNNGTTVLTIGATIYFTGGVPYIWATGFTSTQTSMTGVTYYYFQENDIREFWVKPGTVIDGDNFIVTEYAAIT